MPDPAPRDPPPTAGIAPADAPSDAEVLAPGDVLGGYVVEERIGLGGMGVVYRAHDPALDRAVAVKVISPAYAADPALRARFVEESRAAAALDHPHVVPIHRADEEDGRLYIAMRLVRGSSLADLLADGVRWPAGRAARLVAQIASALDAAHARGIVHRDVTPANILVADPGGDDHAYLTDFGLAVRSGGAPAGISGTPGYRAPELEGGGPVGPATDVFGLGAVLYRMLTGRAPDGADPEAPSRVAAGVPPAFDVVVARALAADPGARYAAAGELAAAALDLRFDLALVHSPATEVGPLTRDLLGLGAEIAPAGAGPDLELALRSSNAVAVAVGADGLGAWAREALIGAEELAGADPGFQIVTVLLPGAPDPRDPRLAFLSGRPWVDLRDPEGVDDGVRALLRLCRGEGPARPGTAAATDVCPYRGLAAFEADHADVFVGREAEVALALGRLRAARHLTVLGPSGSGKSSLLRAGVVPALTARGWPVAVMSPGAHPVAALAAALAPLAAGDADALGARLAADERALDTIAAEIAPGPDERLVILVDQLEEIFTVTDDDDERDAALGALRYAATIPGGRAVVLVAMRADFSHRAAAHPDLRALLEGQQILLGPLDRAALRRVVEEPARRAGLEVEPGLARTIVADVGDRVGALPLLEHLLLEVWERRSGATLTLAGYVASGGVEGALAKRAEDTHAALPPARREVARRVLLRLVQPGEGAEDTRRTAEVAELTAGPGEGDADDVGAVLDALAAARLVTLDRDPVSGAPTAEITHEALIRGWPRLREWIEADRDRLRRERRLGEAAREWDDAGRDADLLYGPARLAAWEGDDASGLGQRDRDFLAAGRARADAERSARRRRTRIAIAALSAAVVAFAGIAGVALWQRGEAEDQRALALARKLAVDAETVLPADPELAILLAREGYDTRAIRPDEEILRRAVSESHLDGVIADASTNGGVLWTPDGRSLVWADKEGDLVIHDVAAGTSRTLAGGGTALATRLVLSPDGRQAFSGTDLQEVRRWDLEAGRSLPPLVGHTAGVTSVAPLAGGRLASAAEDGELRIWDLESGRTIRRVAAHSQRVADVFARPDGRALVTVGYDGLVRVWNADGTGPVAETAEPGVALSSGAFSPDGRRVAFGSADATLRIWTPATGQVRRLGPYEGGASLVRWSADGNLIHIPSTDSRVRVIDWRAGQVVDDLQGGIGDSTSFAVAPDGRRAASTNVDGGVLLWDVAPERRPLVLRGSPKDVLGVDWSPDGSMLLTPGNDGVVRTWATDASGPPLSTVRLDPGEVWTARFSPDGRSAVAALFNGDVAVVDLEAGRVARRIDTDGALVLDADWSPDGDLLAAGLNDNTARLYDARTGRLVRSLEGSDNWVWGLAFSPDGSRIATSGLDATVRVWDTATGQEVARTPAPEGIVWRPSFSADGRLVVFGGDDRSVHVWQWETGEEIATLDGHDEGVIAAAFDPSGERLASSAADGTVRIWDWRRGVALAQIDDWAGNTFGVAWSPDGSRLAATAAGGEVRILTCDTCGPVDDVLGLADRRVTRELSEEERATYLPDE